MATKAVYDECVRLNRKRGLWHGGDHTGYKPPLRLLFGEKLLVNKREFDACSESEKRRHLNEDRILRSLYIEYYPNGVFLSEAKWRACMNQ